MIAIFYSLPHNAVTQKSLLKTDPLNDTTIFVVLEDIVGFFFNPVTNQPFAKGGKSKKCGSTKKKKVMTENLQMRKRGLSDERVRVPVKEQHMHQKVYSVTVGQQRLQMQYA